MDTNCPEKKETVEKSLSYPFHGLLTMRNVTTSRANTVANRETEAVAKLHPH